MNMKTAIFKISCLEPEKAKSEADAAHYYADTFPVKTAAAF